ncbi:MAG: ABC transporter substrate-binding protein [Clostridia bacterium]|nr:ABC transporter substrate-binding protein [Clostridia bacterium]
MKKLLCVVMAVLMMATMFAACGGNGDSTTTTAAPGGENTGNTVIKLGGIGPLTGAAATYGIGVQNGAKIAVDEINALGGIQFEFNMQDDEHDPEKSVNAYNNLMDWGMQILIGSVTTNPCIAVAAESYEDRIFEVTPSASSLDVVDGKDNVFQVCFSDPNQGTASAQYISDNALATKIAIIYKNDDAYSTGIYNKFVEEAGVKGLEIVYTGTFTTDTENDFSVQLGEAQKAGADLVFLPIYFTPASLILKQADAMGYAPKFFGVDGMDGILGIKGFDTSLAEGVYLLTPFSADATDDATVKFVTEYQKRHNEIPNQFAADAYDAVYTVYEAIQKAGVTASMSAEEICEKLIPVMTQIEVAGLTGTMTWSATGEVSKEPMAVIIKDGVYVGANVAA